MVFSQKGGTIFYSCIRCKFLFVNYLNFQVIDNGYFLDMTSTPTPIQQNSKAKKWEFNNIILGHNITRADSFTVFKACNTSEYVRLHFGLRGDYRFTYKQLSKSFDLAGGHHNIMYSKGIDLEIENKTLELETFGISFPKNQFLQFTENSDDLLQDFLSDLETGKSAILSKKWGAVTPAIQKVIDEVVHNPYQGNLQNIFLLAKSLELLVLCIDNYQQKNTEKHKYVRTRADKEKIMAARDFINERISSPPTLSQISQNVGMNEFKLKHGFKEVFSSTVFGYLSQRRLNLAKQYLLDTDKTAADIAFDLGYSSPQYFGNAFKKHFGISPKTYQQNPKQ